MIHCEIQVFYSHMPLIIGIEKGNSMVKERFIYGPVPSRRLGRSLGVDLVPYKVCSYNCVYCQIGVTPEPTVLRKSYGPPGLIVKELKARLAEGVAPDFITLGGSGEPTLNLDIGKIIKGIKDMTDIPVAVITNGSTLSEPPVREALLKADVALPSLDAPNQRIFTVINRPHQKISFERMARGLIEFRQIYSGRIWLEIFLVAGINDSKADMADFKNWCGRIKPDKIHLNTVVRPPAEAGVMPASPEKMALFKELLGNRAEIVVSSTIEARNHPVADIRGKILSILSRRPCTAGDIAAGLGIDSAAVNPHLKEMIHRKVIEPFERDQTVYYRRVMKKGV